MLSLSAEWLLRHPVGLWYVIPYFHWSSSVFKNLPYFLCLTQSVLICSWVAHVEHILFCLHVPAKISEEHIWTTKGLVTGEWMIFHIEELCDTCISPNNIQMIKLNRTKWPWLVACAGGEAKKFTQICGVENWRKVITSKPRPLWKSIIKVGSIEIRLKTMNVIWSKIQTSAWFLFSR